jgi:hypothetical protein
MLGLDRTTAVSGQTSLLATMPPIADKLTIGRAALRTTLPLTTPGARVRFSFRVNTASPAQVELASINGYSAGVSFVLFAALDVTGGALHHTGIWLTQFADGGGATPILVCRPGDVPIDTWHMLDITYDGSMTVTGSLDNGTPCTSTAPLAGIASDHAAVLWAGIPYENGPAMSPATVHLDNVLVTSK